MQQALSYSSIEVLCRIYIYTDLVLIVKILRMRFEYVYRYLSPSGNSQTHFPQVGAEMRVQHAPLQGRSKHLETGPDVNTVKPHGLIN